ncbi:MAG: alpha/beta hydrolase [bacterium]
MKRSRMIAFVVLAALAVGGCYYLEGPINERVSTTPPVQRPYVIEPKTVMAADANMAYMEAGSGPDVVLIHGGVIPMHAGESLAINPLADISSIFIGYLPLSQSLLHSGAVATADSWNYNIQALAEAGFHVVAPDLPGFGASDKPDKDYTLEDFTGYLAAFMDEMGMEKASLVGHGLGGKIAAQYALENPDRVNKLVLVDSFGGKDSFSLHDLPRWAGPKYIQYEKAAKVNVLLPTVKKMYGSWEKPLQNAMYSTLNQDVKHASLATRKNIIAQREGNSKEFIENVTDYKMRALTSEEMRKEVEAAHKALMVTGEGDLADNLSKIRAPVLIIRGQYDPIITEDEALYMDYELPVSNYHKYSYSGHYPMVEETEKFNYDLINFLNAEFPEVKEKED